MLVDPLHPSFTPLTLAVVSCHSTRHATTNLSGCQRQVLNAETNSFSRRGVTPQSLSNYGMQVSIRFEDTVEMRTIGEKRIKNPNQHQRAQFEQISSDLSFRTPTQTPLPVQLRATLQNIRGLRNSAATKEHVSPVVSPAPSTETETVPGDGYHHHHHRPQISCPGRPKNRCWC